MAALRSSSQTAAGHEIDLVDGMPPPIQSLDQYTFPSYRLKRVLEDPNKTPLVLVACGSFSPPTYLHLRMAEQARDYAHLNSDFEVVGGFLSPVGDAYKKAGLASAQHRINMCNLAVQTSSKWIAVDPWEPLHKEYLPTAQVLDHFSTSLNGSDGGILTSTGERKKIHVALLAGADLIQTMSTPGLWAQEDLEKILGHYGAFILERAGTDIDDALANLQRWRDNIRVIPQLIQNDVSSTKIRLFTKRGMSIRYLLPDNVDDYIQRHGLYLDDEKNRSDKALKGKEKAEMASTSGS